MQLNKLCKLLFEFRKDNNLGIDLKLGVGVVSLLLVRIKRQYKSK